MFKVVESLNTFVLKPYFMLLKISINFLNVKMQINKLYGRKKLYGTIRIHIREGQYINILTTKEGVLFSNKKSKKI